jgi:hypothetical protein
VKRRVCLGDLDVGIDGRVIKLIYKATATEGLFGLNWLWIIRLFMKMVMNVRFEITAAVAMRVTGKSL